MGRLINSGDTVAPRNFILFGDSRTADSITNNALDWFSYAQALVFGGPRFKVLRNAGIAGNTTQNMVDRIQADVFDYNPDAMSLWTFNNDGNTTLAGADSTYLKVKGMVEDAVKRGILVFLISEIPNQGNGINYNVLVKYYNNRIRALAATTRGVVFVDFNSVLSDPLDVAGKGKAAAYRDNPHLSPYGAFLCGKAMAAALSPFAPYMQPLLVSVVDQRGTNTNSPNIFDGGLMQGSGGTKGSGHTGTLADGHTTSGSATAILSTPVRADGYGNNQVYEITAASASDSLTDTILTTTSRYLTGGTYIISASVKIENPVNLTRSTLILSLTSGINYNFGLLMGQNVGPLGATDEMQLFAEFTIPTGLTITASSFRFLTQFSAAGSAKISIGRLSIVEQKTP